MLAPLFPQDSPLYGAWNSCSGNPFAELQMIRNDSHWDKKIRPLYSPHCQWASKRGSILNACFGACKASNRNMVEYLFGQVCRSHRWVGTSPDLFAVANHQASSCNHLVAEEQWRAKLCFHSKTASFRVVLLSCLSGGCEHHVDVTI